MLFKNATSFIFTRKIEMTYSGLETAAEDKALPELSPMSQEVGGFVPFGSASFCFEIWPGVFALRFSILKKSIPGAAVRRKTAKAITDIESDQGRKVGTKERQQIKDDVLTQILPGALVTEKQFRVVVDTVNDLLVIDSASPSICDTITSALRSSLGSLPIRPVFSKDLCGVFGELLARYAIRDSEETKHKGLFLTGNAKLKGLDGETIAFKQLGSHQVKDIIEDKADLLTLELGFRSEQLKETVCSFNIKSSGEIKSIKWAELPEDAPDASKDALFIEVYDIFSSLSLVRVVIKALEGLGATLEKAGE